MRKRTTLRDKKQQVKRERDPIPWRYCLLTLFCGVLLVGGFFWAARQHFSAMNLGITNAKLRQQKESLEAEQRRLFITKEISLSPNEIKKVAKKIGLQDLTSLNIETITSNKDSEKKSSPEVISDAPIKTALANQKAEKTEDKSEAKNDSTRSEKVKETKETKDKSESSTNINNRPQIAKSR